MAVLSKLICNNEEIGFSDVLVENGVVRVIDGPLYSLEGIIKSIDHRKQRAKIRLNFLGEERTVDLGISILKPI
jgi:transcriptional antiterminator NusG